MKMELVKWKDMWKSVLLALFLVFTIGMPVKASDSGMTMTLQQTVKDADIKETPDKSAETLKTVEKGTGVIVYGEPQDSWSEVEYDGAKGYMESSALEAYMTDDVEKLEEEFDAVGEETVRVVEESEMLQKSKRTSFIWGTVIAVLVGAIFVVGIVSAIKKDKGETETETSGEEKGEET